MTHAFLASWPPSGRTIEHRGALWSLARPVLTPDGFLIAWGTPLDATDDDLDDTSVFAGHSFFLGRLES